MHKVQRSVLVPYSDAQMFELVAGVEHYPEFMPWCGGAEIRSRDAHGMQASVTISIAGIRLMPAAWKDPAWLRMPVSWFCAGTT